MVSIYSLVQLKQTWKEGRNKSGDMEQFGVKILIVCMLCQVLTTMWTAEKYADYMGWIVTKAAQMRGISKAGKRVCRKMITNFLAYRKLSL